MVSHSRVLPALLFSLAQLSDFWLASMASSLPCLLSFLTRRGSVWDGEADAHAQLTLSAEVELHSVSLLTA